MKQGTFSLRALPAEGRVLEAAKFRDRVPALETTTGAVPKVSRRTTGRPREQGMLLQAGGKRYEGTREMVGVGADQSSDYVVVRRDARNGVMTITPLAAWYTFRPSITHRTLGIDDAEALLAAKDRKALKAEMKLKKLTQKDVDDDEEAGGGGLGGRGGAGGMLDADDFDDGAGPDWDHHQQVEFNKYSHGLGDKDEDGNDGLDMEDDEFRADDDEDEGIFDDDEQEGLQGRLQAQHTRASMRNPGSAVEHEDDPEALAAAAAAAQEEDDDSDDDRRLQRGISDHLRRTKEDLRAERRAMRADEDGSDEDDEDPLDEGAEALRRILSAGQPVAEADAEADAAPAGAAGASATGAGGKRPLSPSAAAEEAAKRARLAKETAAQLARSQQRRRFEERDIVMLLHEKGKLPIKELIRHFKPLISCKEDQEEFLKIVKQVAWLEPDGDRQAKLKDETLGRYELR